MIHPTAIIEPGAQLGADVRIGPLAYVAATAVLGDGCVLAPHAVVLDHTTLGAHCTVHSGAVIGDLPQDLSFGGEPSYVVTGDHCTFREGVTIHRGTKPGTTTRIGHRVFMMANTHAAHNCEVGDHVIMANGALLGGYVTVGERAFIGGNVGVHQFCRIGRLAMVGSMAFISKDLPLLHRTQQPKQLRRRTQPRRPAPRRTQRRPARPDQTGLCHPLSLRPQHLQARETLRADTGNPFAAEFADFIDRATRGLCRPSFDTADASDA